MLLAVAGAAIALVSQSDSESELNPYPSIDKPIIYLYPEETTEVSVELGHPEKLLYSYPEYLGSWNVVAEPDGKLTDTETGKELYSLYWEGKSYEQVAMEDGFYVTKSEIVPFLEEKLDILGLNYREKEEFIIYWLPIMSQYEHLFVRFASMEEIEEYMPLKVSPKPDSTIRIMMQFKGIDGPIEVTEQKLTTPVRTGFTVVEWGGTELK